jgi:uroporphyrinogen-III synthase
MHIPSLPKGLKVAAIGPKTAAAIQSAGVQPDFVPDEYIAEAILPGLGDIRGSQVLLLRADLARATLPQAIQKAGGLAHEIAVYNTLPVQPNPQALEVLRQGVDVVTFTSSSTVRNFVHLTRQADIDPQSLPGSPLIACIGPITAQAAGEQGLPVGLIAEKYTTDGLIQALLEYRETNGSRTNDN